MESDPLGFGPVELYRAQTRTKPEKDKHRLSLLFYFFFLGAARPLTLRRRYCVPFVCIYIYMRGHTYTVLPAPTEKYHIPANDIRVSFSPARRLAKDRIGLFVDQMLSFISVVVVVVVI